MTIKRLIGTAPSQIPRNKDLGNLAFQNKEAPRFDTLTIDGAVGIGTNTPSYALDVFPVSGSANSIIRAYGPSIARLSLQNSTRHYSMSVQGSSLLIYDETGGATRASLLSTGEFTFANGVTPQYYNEQTLTFPSTNPVLSLDFANTESVDKRINFNRESTASYYNDGGTISYAANNEPRINFDPTTGICKGFLIEESRTNILLSNMASMGSYGYQTVGCTSSPEFLAPDNTMSAAGIIENTSSLYHYSWLDADNTSVVLNNNATYTFSMYVKAGIRSKIQFGIDGSSSGGSLAGSVNFDLTTQTASSAAGYVNSSSPSIQTIKNGWYRISFSVYNSSGSNVGVQPFYYILNDSLQSSYTGDSSAIALYVWGAQIELGTFPTSIIKSNKTFTSRASSATYFNKDGILTTAGVDQPRYGYAYDTTTGQWLPQGLITEYAATNYIGYSNGTYGWSNSNTAATIRTNNYATGLDGTKTALRIQNVANGGWHMINAVSGITSGSVYTWSFWAKSNTGTNQIVSIYIEEDSPYSQTNKTITVTSEWQRFYLSKVAGGANYRVSIRGDVNGPTYDILFWGHQLEGSFYPTSFINTNSGISVSRAPDFTFGTAATRATEYANIFESNFYNLNVSKYGTIYAEFSRDTLSNTDGSYLFNLKPALGGSESLRIRTGADTRFQHVTTTGVVGFDQQISTLTSGQNYKVIAAFSPTEISFTNSANPPTTVSGITLDSKFNSITIGDVSGVFNIKKISLYNTKLVNTNLQALTAF